jgi:hypothetical protein
MGTVIMAITTTIITITTTMEQVEEALVEEGLAEAELDAEVLDVANVVEEDFGGNLLK